MCLSILLQFSSCFKYLVTATCATTCIDATGIETQNMEGYDDGTMLSLDCYHDLGGYLKSGQSSRLSQACNSENHLNSNCGQLKDYCRVICNNCEGNCLF